MQSDIAIRTHGLGKCYRIGEAADLTLSFREALAGAARSLGGRLLRRAMATASDSPSAEAGDGEEFWALRDLDLEIRRGEVVGILGRNGAGKSTLLKVLSRITAPTTGRAEVQGRVGSLLEVGTGFHLELTGRENVYLNGAILGMHKAEIEAKFDEIVEFAEIGRFIDTPVKRYSSGMRMRLGFAVAAFLEPEILFVDEVLSVGDAAFRKKCMGKMDSIAGEGRTILFVSHNMAAISNLCTRVILIEEGRCVRSGAPQEMIQHYLDRCAEESMETAPGVFDLTERQNGYGDRQLIVQKVELLDRNFAQRSVFAMGEPLKVRVHVEGLSAIAGSTVSLILKDSQDQWLADLNSLMSCRGIKEPRTQSEVATLEIERLPLMPGTYHLAISIARGGAAGVGRLDFVNRAAVLEITEADVYGSGHPMSHGRGLLYLEGAWSIEGSLADTPEPEES
ncbi:MAG: ABC transporter ATP-binding protein [Deltaproteobacteria bacterium]|nr:ABC transporter ATP-binding protein [Deltaproteobacteria bacterium]MBW2418515.1 ABC transporter ATP-binding protein [Deltaproteobacteria bacterium]